MVEYELIPLPMDESVSKGKPSVLVGTIIPPAGLTIKDIPTYSCGGGNYWAISADVDIDEFGEVLDVPVFYHCQGSNKAGELALTGGVPEAGDDTSISSGSPFVAGDRVIVINDGDSYDLESEKLRIVGYEDGLPRQCVFQFRLTRDDDEVITEGMLGSIRIYQEVKERPGNYMVVGFLPGYRPDDDEINAAFYTKSGNKFYYSREIADGQFAEGSYDAITQIWTIQFYKEGLRDHKYGKDFWVSIFCEKSVDAQYVEPGINDAGYIYKTDDFFKEENALYSKFYEMKIPYYEVVSTESSPIQIAQGEDIDGFFYGSDEVEEGGVRDYWRWVSGGSLTLTVKSSISYNVRMQGPVSGEASVFPAYAIYKGVFWGDEHAATTCEQLMEDAEEKGDHYYTSNASGELGTIDISSSLGDNGVFDNTHLIQREANTVSTGTHTISLSRSGPSSVIVQGACQMLIDDEWVAVWHDFSVDYVCFAVNVEITASPDT